MKIITNKMDIVVAISDNATVVSNGILIDNVVYGEPGLTIHDITVVPSDVHVQEKCYTAIAGFADYALYVSERDILEIEVENLITDSNKYFGITMRDKGWLG